MKIGDGVTIPHDFYFPTLASENFKYRLDLLRMDDLVICLQEVGSRQSKVTPFGKTLMNITK